MVEEPHGGILLILLEGHCLDFTSAICDKAGRERWARTSKAVGNSHVLAIVLSKKHTDDTALRLCRCSVVVVDSGEEDEGSNGDVSGDEGDGFCGGGRHRGEPRGVWTGGKPAEICFVGDVWSVRSRLETPRGDEVRGGCAGWDSWCEYVLMRLPSQRR